MSNSLREEILKLIRKNYQAYPVETDQDLADAILAKIGEMAPNRMADHIQGFDKSGWNSYHDTLKDLLTDG